MIFHYLDEFMNCSNVLIKWKRSMIIMQALFIIVVWLNIKKKHGAVSFIPPSKSSRCLFLYFRIQTLTVGGCSNLMHQLLRKISNHPPTNHSLDYYWANIRVLQISRELINMPFSKQGWIFMTNLHTFKMERWPTIIKGRMEISRFYVRSGSHEAL